MVNELNRGALFATLIALTLAAGCGGNASRESTHSEPAQVAESAPAQPASGGVTEAAKTEATQIFATRCTPCHGSTGAGDGVASKGLTPPPRNFHEKAWQQSVTDAHIEQIIQYGGAAVGKSPAMPANPDLTSKPEVVAALREHVRSLGQ